MKVFRGRQEEFTREKSRGAFSGPRGWGDRNGQKNEEEGKRKNYIAKGKSFWAITNGAEHPASGNTGEAGG